MKRFPVITILVTLLLLPGCAALSGLRGPAVSKSDANIDQVKIESVNLWAQRKGARVLWVNLPQKSKFDDQSSSAN